MQNRVLVFFVEGQKCALAVSCVERVIRAVEVVPLPSAPPVVSGVIDVGGRVVPVFDIRKRFRLPEHEVSPSDQMIIADTSRRTVALIVDGTAGVTELSDDAVIPAKHILPDVECVSGIVRFEDGLVLIYDLDAFLSLEEEQKLDDVVKPMAFADGASQQESETRDISG